MKGPTLDVITETRETRKTVRQVNDWYRTPGWCVRGLYDALPELSYPTLDPCAGDGALLEAAQEKFGRLPSFRGIEKEPEIARLSVQHVAVGDGLDEPWRGEHVLMNPPFKSAEVWVRKAVEEAQSAAILLRLGFLASQRRHALWTRLPGPWAMVIMSRRPKFTAGGGGDRYDYLWCVWKRGSKQRTTQLHWITGGDS